MRAVLAILLALGGLGLAAGIAEAHANYVRSNPAADARLVRPPTEVRVAFSEPPDARGSEIQVLTIDGKRVDTGSARASGDENGLVVSLAPITEGGYTVAWTALSTVDGHTTKGTFVFAVGNAPLPAVPDVGPSTAPPGPLELAGRALSYAGIALALGVPLFFLIVRPPAHDARRERVLLRIAGGLLIAGPALLALDARLALPDRLSVLLGLRAACGAAVAATCWLGAARRRELAAAAGLVAALTATLVSHAAAGGMPLEIALDLIHIVAVSVWVGGVVALLAAVLPAMRAADTVASSAMGTAVWRFSLVALVCVATLVTTGTVQAFRRLVLVQDLVETPYGIALLAKVVLLSGALALGALNLFVWGPRLRAGRDALRARVALMRGTAVESLAFAAILVAAAALTALAPPAQASGAAYDSTQHVAGLRLELLLASDQPGRNRYVLRVRQGLTPVTNAQRVAFRFTMVEHDMGENELVAEQRAPGEYVAQGSATPMFGTWRIETIVRLPEREDIRAVFDVPIANTSQATAARALRAGPYTVIAFVDPPNVIAGAPFTMNLVVVNATGDPVPGKAITVQPTGPSQAPAAAAPEASPGRYVAPFAALEAGSWQLVIAIGSEGTSVFEVVVQR